jgi:hypothetical protein
MYTLNNTRAAAIAALHKNNNVITVAQLQQLLQNVSVTFAQIDYCTNVQLAAAHKAQSIQKVTTANVILCSNVAAQSSVYARKVRKHAARYAQNDAQAVAAFTAQQNYFVHTATHCIVAHAQHADKVYLYAIYNNAQSVYMHNNAVVSKQHVAQYCTASAAKALLQKDDTVHNKTHNIVHNVQVRTIALSNIVSVRARKQMLTV